MTTKIEEIEISKLKTNPVNVKTHPKEQINDLAIQIQQEPGFTNPLIIDEDYVIWVGHGRLEAVKSLGWDKVPCIMVHNMSEAEKYRYMIKDNQVNESPWEKENLQIAYDKVDPILFEPFEMDIQDIGVKLPIQEESEPIPEPPAEPKAKLGDIYELGNHRIMCGDSTKDLDKLMNGNNADMVFSDPPWGVNYEGGSKKQRKLENDNVPNYEIFLAKVMKEIKSVMNPNPTYYIMHGDSMVYDVLSALKANGIRRMTAIYWVKDHAQFGGFKAMNMNYKQQHEPIAYCFNEDKSGNWYGSNNQTTIWNAKRSTKNEYHPTQKPPEIPEKGITNSSKEGDIILEPFLGSGSTLIACEQTNRVCYGMELDPAYIDVIIERWENFTGKKAKLINSAKTIQEDIIAQS